MSNPRSDPNLIRFLLVEDNPDHADLFLRFFTGARILNKVHLLSSGEDVLPYLRLEPPHQTADRPDVIVLDLRLQVADGNEILCLIKADLKLQSIPVVILSTSSDPRDRQSAADRGASHYLVKPLEIVAMQELVRALGFYWAVQAPPKSQRRRSQPCPPRSPIRIATVRERKRSTRHSDKSSIRKRSITRAATVRERREMLLLMKVIRQPEHPA